MVAIYNVRNRSHALVAMRVPESAPDGSLERQLLPRIKQHNGSVFRHAGERGIDQAGLLTLAWIAALSSGQGIGLNWVILAGPE